MYDFSQKYRGEEHFGLWADEGADVLGQHDAWAIVCEAVKRSYDEDVRSTELEDAIRFLEFKATRGGPFREFRIALGIPSAPRRYQALRDIVERIGRILSA